ncbi:Mannose-binding lectin [Plasmopara halstedii]|uniref:Mannose-binding lectin n=1 Tax=Plasmopara halstedii TaxID=4781 RepID=A0A0P1B3S1_PLAHL|nr:Mannose-binding lectin [Plasmopara halstedii]CEG48200.1 Mannose-binding lectin [Plasmopara halstedii]|eukprot:XP_024584569.1 Mannose-binding lectin [Plasmopara halstedii]
MKIIFSFLVALPLVKGIYKLPDGMSKCPVVGGPHGKPFDDTTMVQPGQKVESITICYNDRVDGIGMKFTPLSGFSQDPFHGSRKHCNESKLASDEYIIIMEAQTVKDDDHTKISYVRFMTNKKNIIEGGKETEEDDKKASCKAPEKHQLGGFFGRYGEEIDAIGPIWVQMDPIIYEPYHQNPQQVPVSNGQYNQYTQQAPQDSDSSDSIATKSYNY